METGEKRTTPTQQYDWEKNEKPDLKTAQEWKKLALTDETGLRNKRWWKLYSQQIFKDVVIDNKLPISFLWMDLNYLGILNDELGELKTDEVLEDIGRIFLDPVQGFRKSDIPIHFHGDLFGVLMPLTRPETAYNAVFRVLHNVESLGDTYNLPPSFTVGISGVPLESVEIQSTRDLLMTASIACSTKKKDRNSPITVAVYQPSMKLTQHKKLNKVL